MLSDDALNKLMQPIIDRQENINNYVVELICKRIKEIGELTPSDIYRLERLLKMGGDVKKINEEIAVTTNLQVQDIKKLIKTVAINAYVDTKPYYDYRYKSFIPFEKNEPLQRVVKAIQKQTADEYKNLAKAQAFMIRDLKNPKILKPTPLAKTYYSVIDEAIQATQGGVVDYNTSMRRTIKQLVDSGIRRVEYNTESGRRYSQRLDTAVRRNLLDGVRAINQGVQDVTGKQFGADGKEISVHEFSAPDHEPIQGHQFSDAEWEKLQNQQSFEDINGRHFTAIQRPIGVWNCRHFAYSIIIGVDKPNFTDKQLVENIDRNNKGYTAKNGRHYTMYQCTQLQRKYETDIRYAKEGQIAAITAGNDKLAMEYQAKVTDLLHKYDVFSKGCGLKIKPERIRVDGYKKLK